MPKVELVLRYYVSGLLDEPEAVRCEQVGYPHRDAQGRVQYDNSHYGTREGAWPHLLEALAAGVSIMASRVEQIREQLRCAEAGLVEETLRHQRALAKFEQEKRP